jgi:hypothetical protein
MLKKSANKPISSATWGIYGLTFAPFTNLLINYVSIRSEGGRWANYCSTQREIVVIKHAVMTSLLGLSLVAPALAGDVEDDQAELASAKVQYKADQATYKADKMNKAAKAVLAADKAAINNDQHLINAIVKDIMQDKKEVSPH